MTMDEIIKDVMGFTPTFTLDKIKECMERWHEQFLDFGRPIISGKPIDVNILIRGKEILYDRSEEKERQYGPMDECITKTARLASEMSDTTIDKVDVYNVLIALKLAREAYAHKEDNQLDAVVYMAAKNDYLNKINQHPDKING